MSYMTSYYMEINRSMPAVILDPIKVEAEVERVNVFEDGNAEDGWCAWTTWYDWEEDMILLSSKFPGLLFKLHGEGERPEDLWDAYFLDGKVQICPAEIIYDDFDPSKLIEGDIKRTEYSYQ